ncbi:hypothetical protein N7540_007431 [Penicillium herquei]|nr:hypothetical protein N7540_007431 [Penicillium herquei]
MQYTTLAALFFATAALAAPKPQDSDSYATSSDDSEGYDDGYDVPTSIESVLATAIPTTWLMEYETNDAFFTSVIDAMEKGDYPDWVDNLPSAAHAYVTAELQEELSEFTMATSGYESSNTGTLIFPTTTNSATVLTGTGSSTESTSTATGSSKSSSGASSSSSSASSGAASSTSSGGAPAATGTIAMGLAGAAGILGIALAL